MVNHNTTDTLYLTGVDPGFQVRGAHLKKLRRAEGGAKIFGVFRLKNHDFTPTNYFFPNFRGGGDAGGAPWIRPCLIAVPGFFPGTPASYTDRSDRHDILFKVALNTNKSSQQYVRSSKCVLKGIDLTFVSTIF